jgi:hypothetical protein
MSRANFQHERKADYELHSTTVTGTHTVKTGTATYNGIFENPVLITNPAAAFTLTVPDGAYVGQELYVLLTSNSESKTVTITSTTGDDNTLDTAGDFVKYEWFGSTTGWQKVHGEVAS